MMTPYCTYNGFNGEAACSSGECVVNCNSGYYLKDGACTQDCSEAGTTYANNSDNLCVKSVCDADGHLEQTTSTVSCNEDNTGDGVCVNGTVNCEGSTLSTYASGAWSENNCPNGCFDGTRCKEDSEVLCDGNAVGTEVCSGTGYKTCQNVSGEGVWSAVTDCAYGCVDNSGTVECHETPWCETGIIHCGADPANGAWVCEAGACSVSCDSTYHPVSNECVQDCTADVCVDGEIHYCNVNEGAWNGDVQACPSDDTFTYSCNDSTSACDNKTGCVVPGMTLINGVCRNAVSCTLDQCVDGKLTECVDGYLNEESTACPSDSLPEGALPSCDAAGNACAWTCDSSLNLVANAANTGCECAYGYEAVGSNTACQAIVCPEGTQLDQFQLSS